MPHQSLCPHLRQRLSPLRQWFRLLNRSQHQSQCLLQSPLQRLKLFLSRPCQSRYLPSCLPRPSSQRPAQRVRPLKSQLNRALRRRCLAPRQALPKHNQHPRQRLQGRLQPVKRWMKCSTNASPPNAHKDFSQGWRAERKCVGKYVKGNGHLMRCRVRPHAKVGEPNRRFLNDIQGAFMAPFGHYLRTPTNPDDRLVPTTITSAHTSIQGVTTSPSSTTPYSTANTGIAKVTDKARAGPARSIRRKNKM